MTVTINPLFPDVNPDTVDDAAIVIMYCFVVLYSILFLVCFAVLIHALVRMAGWNIVKLLKVLLPWPILGNDWQLSCVCTYIVTARDISLLLNLGNAEYMTGAVSTQVRFHAFFMHLLMTSYV